MTFSEQITPVDIKRVDADSQTYFVCTSVVSDVLLPGEGASDSESILQAVIKTCIDHEDTGLITGKGHHVLYAMGIKLGPVSVNTFNAILSPCQILKRKGCFIGCIGVLGIESEKV